MVKKNLKLWRPDTCECSVYKLYEDDGVEETFIKYVTLEEAQAIIAERLADPVLAPITNNNPLEIPVVCEAHKDLGHTPELHDTILSENVGKNQVIWSLAKSIPDLIETITDDNGDDIQQFKKGKLPDFSFDADRNLTIELPKGNEVHEKVAGDEAAKLDVPFDVTFTTK